MLVDALRGALGRDRPPRPPPVPDDVKSVGVQTPADVPQNPGGDSGTDDGATIPRGVCPACRRAPANWRSCGECQRICADGGSSGGDDDDDDVRPSRTLARCLRRSKSRCLFRTWRRRVLARAKERRDVERATKHRSGAIFRTWREARRAVRAAEHAHAKASTFHRRRMLKSPLAAWRVLARRVRRFTDRARSQHQTKVADGALERYARVRRLGPAWRAWWRFHVTCDVARDRMDRLGQANADAFFLVSAVFGKWRTSVLGARRARTERAAAAVDAKAAELDERERTLDATAGAIIGEHVERTDVALRRALSNEESVAAKLRAMELELRTKDAVIEGNERRIATLLDDARAFEATLARRAVEAARSDREALVGEHELEVAWLRAAVERAFEECVWYRKRYGAVDRDDTLHAFLVKVAGTDRAREMLPKGARLPWVESFSPKRDQLATRTGGPKQRRAAGSHAIAMLGGVPRVPRHGRWGGAHPTHPVTAPWYPSSTLRGPGGESPGGGSFPGFGKGVGSRLKLRASDRAWEAHRRGFALASAASNARDFAASQLAVVRRDPGDTNREHEEHAEVEYTVEIPPSAAKTEVSKPEPKSSLDEEERDFRREKARDDEAASADDVSVRSEREKTASVMSVAAGMLDFGSSEDEKDPASAADSSDDSDDDLFSARASKSARVNKPAIAAAAEGWGDSDDDDDDDDWMFRGKGVKA